MERKNIIIIICVFFLSMAVGVLFSRGCKEDKRPSNVYFPTSPKQNKTDSEKKDNNTDYHSYGGGENYNGFSSSHSSSSSSSSSFSSSSSYDYEEETISPPALLSDEDKAIMLKEMEKNEEKLRKNAKIWLKSKTNNPKLSKKTIEKYKIRSDENYVKGSAAFRQQDYNTAIKYFSETVKDSNSSPITKYFALTSLMDIAEKTKDINLYFKSSRVIAMLCATEDLSLLGIEKDTSELEWIDKVEKSIKARNDPKFFEECVQMKLKKYQGGIDREDAEIEVKEDIAYYTDLYKEMLE